MKNKIDTIKLTSRHPVFPIFCYNIILSELFRGGEDTTEKLGHLEMGNTSVHLLMPDLWCCRGTPRGRDPQVLAAGDLAHPGDFCTAASNLLVPLLQIQERVGKGMMWKKRFCQKVF